jgi:hypothetical protein
MSLSRHCCVDYYGRCKSCLMNLLRFLLPTTLAYRLYEILPQIYILISYFRTSVCLLTSSSPSSTFLFGLVPLLFISQPYKSPPSVNQPHPSKPSQTHPATHHPTPHTITYLLSLCTTIILTSPLPDDSIST